jgi:hypothetical protein
MDLVGRMHRCVPVANSTVDMIYGGPAGGGMTANVNKDQPASALLTSNADHQAKWRKANAELNRQRARDGMRKKRAKGKS